LPITRWWVDVKLETSQHRFFFAAIWYMLVILMVKEKTISCRRCSQY
jgi:hypothetical protein